ncbi:low affinity iron permease family protein [Nocardia colli]|uniref:low affinity iron permease family protein n=1 Tax=Nocardia colli TaxID=2545717 RepID=UPI0035D6E3C5
MRGKLTIFGRSVTGAAEFAAKAGFFVFCVLLVVLWAPTFLLLPSIDAWQLVIDTATTIITFLLVARLQNTRSRQEAMHRLCIAIMLGPMKMAEDVSTGAIVGYFVRGRQRKFDSPSRAASRRRGRPPARVSPESPGRASIE